MSWLLWTSAISASRLLTAPIHDNIIFRWMHTGFSITSLCVLAYCGVVPTSNWQVVAGTSIFLAGRVLSTLIGFAPSTEVSRTTTNMARTSNNPGGLALAMVGCGADVMWNAFVLSLCSMSDLSSTLLFGVVALLLK